MSAGGVNALPFSFSLVCQKVMSMWFSRSVSGRKGVKDQPGDTELPSPSKPLLEAEPAGYVYRSRESSPRKATASTANSTPARIDFPRSVTTPINTTPYDLVFTEAAPARLSMSSTGHGGARGMLSPTGLLQPPTARSQRNPSTVNLADEDLEGTDRLFDPFTGRTIAVLNASGRDGLPPIPQGDTLSTQGEGPVDIGGKHRSSGDLEDPVRQKMWDYLARIRSLQAEVAAMHLAMDGHALGDPWGTTRPGVRSRSGSVNFNKDGMKTAFTDGSSTKLAATPEAMPKVRMASDSDSDEEKWQETKEKRAEEFGELDKMFEKKQEALKAVMVKLKELSSVVRTYHELENPVITSTRQDTWEPKENVFVVDSPAVESPMRAEVPQDALKPLPSTSRDIPRLTLAPILTSSPASSLPSSPLPPHGSVSPTSSPIRKTPLSGRRVSLEMGTGGGRHGYIPVSPGNGPPPLPSPLVPSNH